MSELQSTDAVESGRAPRLVTVAEFPVVQHRHADGSIVTVRLRRVAGQYRTVCSGCDTEFLYQKPRMSRTVHHKSPVLPEVKGNYEDSDGNHP
jgi:hypothetical protein